MTTLEKPTEEDSVRGIPEDARRRFELLQDCRELVISRLSKMVGEALNKMSEELAALALKQKDSDEQRALMDAVSVVRQHRTEIELRFRRSFTDVFERRLFNQAQPGVAAVDAGELTLVDDDVMQQKLAVDKLVHRARGKLDPDEVLGVRARFAALLEREWFEEENHPASPEAIFEALKAALVEIAPKAEVQSALLDAFEPHVSANLNEVYSTVNDRLKANRVLPKIRPQVAIKPGQKRPGDARPGERAAGAPGGDGLGGAGHGHAGAGFGQPGAGQGWGGPHTVQEVQSVLTQLSQGTPAARASATRMLADPDIFAVADLPIPTVEPPLIDAITNLQATSATAPVIPTELLADLADRAREKGSPLDQLTVEIVSMVFDYIYADKRLADIVKQQLLRLQVVAVKAALIDRSFFARRQHPMRRLIDRISEVAADPDADLSPGAPLVKGLESVVEWVLLDFEQDLGTFDKARERIEKLAAEEAVRAGERIAQLTRDAERSEQVAQARDLARARISDRLDPDTPEFVRGFLDEWWSLALGEAQVAGAESAVGFEEGLTVAEGLIWSAAPKYPEDVPKLAALLPKLIKGLMTGVRMIAMPDDRRQAFFDELLKTHTRLIETAKQTAAAAAARKPSNLRMRPDGKIQFTPIVQAVRAVPQTTDTPIPIEQRSALPDLRRGDFIEVDDGKGEFLAFKLSWVSPAHKLYVLSRFPDEARSLERAQLAAMFQAGRARVVEGGSTLEKAIESIASKPAADDSPATRPHAQALAA